MAGKIVSSVLVYSPSWPVSQALYSFCQHEDDNKNTAANADVNVVIHAEDILHKINEMKPDVLVLDISLRVNCGLMSTLRQNYPSLPVVIVQRRFLFSDRVAAEYFGHIWLKEYDALLAEYPAVLLQEHLSHPGLAGTECGGNSGYLQFVRREQDSDDVQREMVFRLRLRLFDLLKSPRLCEVVINWLGTEASPAEVGASLSRSAKLVYHYRREAMRALKISRYARDFIPSITVKIKQEERRW